MSKLCIIGPTSPYRGGISHYTTLLAQELSGNYEVEVFNFSRMYPSLLFPGKTQLDESEVKIGVQSQRTLDSINPLSWRRTGELAGQSKPQRVIFQWWHPFFGPAYRGVSKALRKVSPETKQVFLCHNVLPHEATFVDRYLAKLGYNGADTFVVQSTSEKEALQEIAPGKPTQVHAHPSYDVFAKTPISREEARAKLKLEGDVILFFGYVREYKGLRYVIEAMPEILKRRPVTLVVAGEFYEDRQAYQSMIDRLGVGDSVRVFDEYISNEEVSAFFEASDLVVQPYVTATQSGISQIAFAFGKPVVATAVGGLPDVIDEGRTGFLVPPKDSSAIATAVTNFFEQKLGESMREAIEVDQRERFSWASLARCVEEA